MKEIKNKDFKRILIHAPNWLGDIIMSYPAIEAIRRRYEDAHIAILGKPSMISIFKNAGVINELIPIDEYKKVGKSSFELGILLPNSFISAYRIFRMGIKNRVGYSTDMRLILLTNHLSPHYDGSKKAHTTDHYMNMINKILGISIDKTPKLKLPISDDAIDRAKNYLQSQGILNENIFAYGIGATNGLGKIWKEQYYAEVANTLHDKYNAKTLFVATPNDMEIATNITSYLNHKPIIPNTDLATIAAILSFCRGFIGNDSGAMHLASAIGIPTVGLYFATPWEKNQPRGEKTDVICKYICNICGGIKCTYNDKTYECRSIIKPDEVITCLENLL